MIDITSVTISHFDPIDYAKNLSKYLLQLQSQRRSEYLRASQDSYWDGGEAFEPITGGICIQDCEWYLCEHPYKRLFTKKTGSAFGRICPLDDGILLRGPEVYYFLVAHKPKGKPLKAELINLWRENICSFLRELREMACIARTSDPFFCNKDSTVAKLILGILDNLRHIVLHCLTAEILMGQQSSYCFHLKEKQSCVAAEELLTEVLATMEQILFQGYMSSVDSFLRDISNRISMLLNQTFSILLFSASDIKPEYCLKLHREADSFWENYVTMRYVSRKIRNHHVAGSKLRFFCVMSGALELGILLAHLLPDYLCSTFCVGFKEDYLLRHSTSMMEENFLPEQRDSCSYLLDDNTMTGSTICIVYKIIRELYEIQTDKSILLRHPSINRIPQMVAYGQAVNVDYLREHCLGMLNPSPYSRIAMHSNIGGEYLDCFGVFTMTGEFFLRYLYKNGLFFPNSEVDCYGKDKQYILEKEYDLLL